MSDETKVTPEQARQLAAEVLDDHTGFRPFEGDTGPQVCAVDHHSYPCNAARLAAAVESLATQVEASNTEREALRSIARQARLLIEQPVYRALERLLYSLPVDVPRESYPRRICVDRLSYAEASIRRAVQEVESMGASESLTRAVVRLQFARDAVADHVDALAEEVAR